MARRFQGLLTIKEAAEFLGVSADTLRNWDRAGKLSAARHPVNGYRLYRLADLESLVAPLRGEAADGPPDGQEAGPGRPGTDHDR